MKNKRTMLAALLGLCVALPQQAQNKSIYLSQRVD